MSKLIATTVLPARGGGGFVTFGPDHETEVPEWAAKQMGAHMFENGEHPFPDSNYPGKEEADSTNVDPEREPGAIPPKSGKGSGRDNWAAYANDVDVDIPAEATRDEIIAAIETAGKPTEYSD